MIQDIDNKILHLFHDDMRNHVFDVFFRMVESPLWSNIVILTFALIFIFKERKRFPVISFGLSFLLPLVVSKIVKEIVKRPRPVIDTDALLASIHSTSTSFPSQHATIIMAMAVVLTFYYPRYRFWFYLIAWLVGISRVYLGLHYLTDVLAGFLFGVLRQHLIVVRNGFKPFPTL
jgi:undecaprenyl-diphosphatase